VRTLNFLLEVGTEELPASFIKPALDYLKSSLKEKLEENHIPPSSIEVAGTPRRLILIAYDLPVLQPDREELIVGPSLKAAFKEDGTPTKAAEGFARSRGVKVEDLVKVENPPGRKGVYVAVKRTVKGKPSLDILSEILPELITSIPFKKSMRWGTKKVKFARPIKWILALLGDTVVPFEIDGIVSSNFSFGHRFLSPEPFAVENPLEFLTNLEDRFVIADIEKRKSIIEDGVKSLAQKVGGKLLEDEDLLEEVTNLVEYPYPILGTFDESFLSLPKEVPYVVMKDHQKFFSVLDENGNLKNYFIGVANIKPSDESVIRNGYEKVLRARLSDALFFFNEDRKKTLEERVPHLEGIVFHEKLGTMLDKTKRLEALSPIVYKLLYGEEGSERRAAYLCKADLLTEMVNEFPELQGTMGKYYALLDGEKKEVAEAIEEHYLPRFSGDKVASTPEGIALSISEKVDNLVGFIGSGLKPTGSADPFALRRNALGLIQTLVGNRIFLNLEEVISRAVELYLRQGVKLLDETKEEVLSFIKERLRGFLKDRGFRYDTIDAVLPVSNDVYDILLRAEAVDELRKSPEFEEVLITLRRVVNIIPKDFKEGPFTPEGIYEENLYNAFLKVKEEVVSCLKSKDYERALLSVKELKPYVDEFFDNVVVMDKEESVKNRRLSLLKNIAKHLLEIIDFSKIAI